MNYKFPKRKARFGKPNFNYKNVAQNERLRWMTVPIEHKVTLKEVDMVVPLVKGKLSDILYDKDGNRNSHVLTELPVDRDPETLVASFFDTPDATPIEIENGKATNIKLLFGDTKNEITIKYKLKLDLPGDRDKRNRLINCMGEEIHLAVKNKQQEAFSEPEPAEDETQADLDKAEKAAKAKAEKADKKGEAPAATVQ
jgi:hypothetical protein